MPEASIDIERVVREVLAELRRLPQADGSAAPSHASQPAPATARAPQPAAGEGDLKVTSRVVTMTELDGRLARVRRVVVGPQAIVTPAVRDELERRRIAIVHSTETAAMAAGLPRLVLVAHGSKFDPAGLSGVLAKEGITIESHQMDCIIRATDLLAEEVNRPMTLGMLLSRHTAAALCLANRHHGVRAVSAADMRAASAAVASVGANLLVVNPGAVSFFQMKQMAGEFCRRGAAECPEVFRERLG